MMDVVKENDFIIIKKMYEDIMRLTKIEKDSNFFTGRCKTNLMNLVGIEYGSILELKQKTREMVPIVLTPEEMYELSTCQSELICGSDITENDSKDNRNLLDDGKSQKLSTDEIESLKESELSESQIISTLVSNSATFADKSAFSQAKYIKKKRQKYSNYYKLYKPSVRLLVQMYYTQSPSKINFIRIDTLGQMLAAVNVRSGGRYIVIDNFVGLLSAAVLDRLVGNGDSSLYRSASNDQVKPSDSEGNGQPMDSEGNGQPSDSIRSGQPIDFGSIIQVYTEQGPCSTWRSCIDSLNIPSDVVSKVMRSLQIKSLYNLLNGIEEEPKREHRKNMIWNEVDGDDGSQDDGEGDDDGTKDGGDESTKDGNNQGVKKRKLDEETAAKKRKLDEKAKRRMERKEEENVAKEILSKKLIDGALINIRNVDPASIMDIVLEFLSPSAPFAIFCINPEPLSTCLMGLKGRCVNLKIHETWMRRYQVLPGRTRPDMMMSGSGGYLLTGIKLLPEAATIIPSSPKKNSVKSSSLKQSEKSPVKQIVISEPVISDSLISTRECEEKMDF